jgi:hypothetical protein
MESYIRQEYNRNDIFLKELNLAFINGFEHSLSLSHKPESFEKQITEKI